MSKPAEKHVGLCVANPEGTFTYRGFRDATTCLLQPLGIKLETNKILREEFNEVNSQIRAEKISVPVPQNYELKINALVSFLNHEPDELVCQPKGDYNEDSDANDLVMLCSG
ncbi:hypothetical protein GE061_005884 [Apolygus lucorum]|uniref:Uncharacterized protein n=1 Tax=Apolygus lucorum TaxID=248454 RepID=A0A8S9X051_APOLU|nr:hypothetical protein GE061_005884 [Apolygus lucorum]